MSATALLMADTEGDIGQQAVVIAALLGVLRLTWLLLLGATVYSCQWSARRQPCLWGPSDRCSSCSMVSPAAGASDDELSAALARRGVTQLDPP